MARRHSGFSEFLSAAAGGLRTFLSLQEEQRRRKEEEEERARAEEERRLRMAGVLAQMSGVPGFEIAGAEEEEAVAAGAAAAPSTPPAGSLREAASRALAPLPPELQEPVLPELGPGAGPVPMPEPPIRPGATVPMPEPGLEGGAPPVTMPTGPGGAAPRSLLDIAEFELGGRDLRVRYDPEARARAAREAQARAAEKERAEAERQRAAFDALNDMDPKAYPRYVEGFDYVNEVDEFAADVRQARRPPPGGRGAASDLAKRELDRKRRLAETLAARLALQEGLDEDQIVSFVTGDPDVGDAISGKDVLKIVRDARKAEKLPTDKDLKERRKGLEKDLGTPQTQLQQDILDSLAEGASQEEIMETLAAVGADEETQRAARRYMRPLGKR